ncbi:hypothetical protein MNBD_GAMMA02-1826 [hydrothermal vent metagenome]|uniref:Sel1 repeat family protein n=1 Tax=hydrothermal vent metagenome TaxID=652676 RepID=A0A3B0VSE0_9ZZZZ
MAKGTSLIPMITWSIRLWKQIKVGTSNDAKWRLKDAAEFGNKHAQYYIGLLHLQEQDQVTGYAWLKLAGKGISNNDHLMASLEEQLSAAELNRANQQFELLKQTYNFQAAIERRAKWRKRLPFGGSHIKGYVPIGWKSQLMNGLMVFDFEVKRDLENFVFDYRYDEGEVTLKDFETEDADVDTPI